MARELVLDVVAKKNSRDLQLLALEFDKLAASVDNSNKSAKQSVTFSKFLDDQIAETRKQVQQLTQEFNKTGSADVFSQLRGTQRNLDSLVRIRKQLGDVGETTNETKHELSGLDAEVKRLSADYFNLTRDALAPAEQEFAKLTDRQKTQAETVKILQQRYRDTGDAFAELDLVNARRDMERLDNEVEHFGISLEHLRQSAPNRSTFTFGSFVESQIAKARTEVDRLRTDLNKGGGVNIFGDLRKAESDLKTLETIGKDIGVAVEGGVEDGAQQGVKFLGQAFGGLPPEAQAGIAAGVASALLLGAPAIGAALSGALLAGIGAAGIGTAIAVQLKNPHVSAAFSDLKTSLLANLTDATSAFAPVLIQGAEKFGATFGRIEPVLKAGFDALAGPAERLFNGINFFIEEAAPGLSKGLKGAGIVIDEIAADLPELGLQFGRFFALIGDGGAGGADAIGKIIRAMGLLVVATGAELDILSKVFTALEISADLAAGKFPEAAVKIAELNGGFHDGAAAANDLNTKIKALGGTAGGAAGSLNTLAQAVTAFNNQALEGKLLTLQFKDGIQQLTDDLRQNNGAFNDNTAAGRQAEEQYLRLAQQAQEAAQHVLDSGGSASQAAQAYQDMKSQLDAAAISAHATQGDIDRLNQSLDNVVKVRKGSVTIEVDITGNGKALVGNQGTFLLSGTGIGLRAGGGPVTAGQPYIVGENGPELMVPDTSGTVIPSLSKLGSPPPAFRASSQASGGTFILQAAPGGDSLTAQYIHALVDHGVLQLVRA